MTNKLLTTPILLIALLILFTNTALAQNPIDAGGALLTKFKPPDKRVRDVTFSPDGSLVAASYGYSDQGGITIWNVSDRSVVVNLLIGTKQAAGVPCITFSEDGKLFAAATDKGDVILWTVGKWRSPKTILRERRRPSDLTIGRNLLGFASDDVALLYNLNTAEVIVLRSKTGEGDLFTGISLSADEKVVAISGRHDATLWNVETRQQLRTWKTKAFTFFESLSGSHLIFGGGAVFAVKEVQVWNVNEQKPIGELREFRGGLFSGAISHSGKLFALSGGNYSGGDLSLWSVDDAREIGYTSFGETPMRGLSFSPDDQTLAVGSEDGFVLLYAVDRLKGPLVKKQATALCGDIALEDNRAVIRSLAEVPLPMNGFGHPWRREIVNSDAVAAVVGAPVVFQNWFIESSAGKDRARVSEFRLLVDDRARANSDHIVFGYTQNPGWDKGFVAKVYSDGRFVAASTSGQCLAYGSLEDLKTDFTTVRDRLISRGLLDVTKEPLTLGADHYGTAFIEVTMNGVSELRSDADDISVLLKGGPAKKREAFSRIFTQEKAFIDSILRAGMKLPRASAN